MSTLAVNPVTGANSPCDGYARRAVSSEAFSTIVSSAANSAGFDAATTNSVPIIQASSTTDEFQQVCRFGFNFDTSPLTADAVITSAVLSIYLGSKANGLGDDSYGIVGFTAGVTNQFRTTEYGNVGSTLFASAIPYSSINAGAFNNFTLNASGIAAINKTGITSLALRSEWDRTGTFGGTWASNAFSNIVINFADSGNVPVLTITYTIPKYNYKALLGVGQ